MRTPIAHAMGYPDRIDSGVSALDMFKVAHLNFEQPDFNRFPCLGLAYEALAAGGNMPAVLNAANEVAVESFLKRRMAFTAIPTMIGHVMQTMQQEEMTTLEDVLRTDNQARHLAQEWLESLQ
jgi:1-deoxy-D-xylulose-5-phosphate reductoisomerase